MRTQYYYGLDVLRFAAALSVCIFHLAFYSWASEGSTTARMLNHATAYPLLVPVSWFGWIGVQVFFVISGFVIANSANGASPLSFIQSRILRLFPAAWVCATLTLLAVLTMSQDLGGGDMWSYLRSMTLWPQGPWIDGVYWSLAVEIAFYFLIFVLLAVRRFSLLPLLAWVLTVASGLFNLWELLVATGQAQPDEAWGWIREKADLLLLRHGMYFGLGIWLWLLSQKLLRRAGWAGVSLAVLFAGVEIWLRSSALQLFEATEAGQQSSAIPLLTWLIAVGVLVAATQFPERFSPRSDTGQTVIRTLGLATYPLYLLHNVFGAGLMRTLLEAGMQRHLALAGAIAVSVSIAVVVAMVIEPRLRNFLKPGLRRTADRIQRFRILHFLSRTSGRIGFVPQASKTPVR